MIGTATPERDYEKDNQTQLWQQCWLRKRRQPWLQTQLEHHRGNVFTNTPTTAHENEEEQPGRTLFRRRIRQQKQVRTGTWRRLRNEYGNASEHVAVQGQTHQRQRMRKRRRHGIRALIGRLQKYRLFLCQPAFLTYAEVARELTWHLGRTTTNNEC